MSMSYRDNNTVKAVSELEKLGWRALQQVILFAAIWRIGASLLIVLEGKVFWTL